MRILCWSKDRAAQLDLLYRSTKLITPWPQLVVIWKASTPEFQKGYEKLFNNTTHILEIEETDFNRNTLEVIDCVQDYISLTTDDTVIFKKCHLSDQDLNSYMQPDIVTFSLRYGLNTVLQDYWRNLYQHPLSKYETFIDIVNNQEWIRWGHRNYLPNYNYGYPFGLDMHVYRKKDLLRWTKDFKFNSTNELESNLYKLGSVCAPCIASFTNSVAVNIPWTNQSGITQSSNISLEEMNTRFLSGEQISLDKILENADTIIGSHQILPLDWESK